MLGKYKNVRKENVLVKGVPCTLVRERVAEDSIPMELNVYEVGAKDGKNPHRVQKGILLDFFGTIVTEHKLPIEPSGYMDLQIGDFEWV